MSDRSELFELLQNPEGDMVKLSREILAGISDVPTPTKVAALTYAIVETLMRETPTAERVTWVREIAETLMTFMKVTNKYFPAALNLMGRLTPKNRTGKA
jgi:hypothetical protein